MKDISDITGCRIPELRSMLLKESQDSGLPLGLEKIGTRGGRRRVTSKLLRPERIFLAA
jgi:hypothetical protein